MSYSPPPTSLYKPLTETDEIRLLELQPGLEDATISCTIRHVKLSGEPSYEALSYEWGSDDVAKAILVNNHPLKVRDNLWNALIHLRSRTEPRTLWIDALCIRQQDTLERNHQVNQMGQIYSSAQKVIAWLGLPDSSSSKAFTTLARLNPQSDLTTSQLSEDAKLQIERLLDENSFQDIITLCSRSYWSRLWIIQEIILAKMLYLQCGTDIIDWTHLCGFLDQTSQYWAKSIVKHELSKLSMEQQKLIATTLVSVPARLYHDWDYARRPSETLPLLELCATYCSIATCQDVKDKILGLRGLAPECCRIAVPADYSSTPMALYAALCRHDFAAGHGPISYVNARKLVKYMGLHHQCLLHYPMTEAQALEEMERAVRLEAARPELSKGSEFI